MKISSLRANRAPLGDTTDERTGTTEGPQDTSSHPKPETPRKTKGRIGMAEMEEEAVSSYNIAYSELNETGSLLHQERLRSIELLSHVTTLVGSVARSPREFDSTIKEISTRRATFTSHEEAALAQLRDARASVLAAGTGAGAGIAIASLAPSALMWTATTFGTASTGTAISTLSGAAASHAALAWLGGGALSVGGSGMAGGAAFLALTGPVGYSVAGIAILSSIGLYTAKQHKSKKERAKVITDINSNTRAVTYARDRINDLTTLTTSHHAATSQAYTACLPSYARDYLSITTAEQERLGTLVNMARGLAQLLSETVDVTTTPPTSTTAGDEA